MGRPSYGVGRWWLWDSLTHQTCHGRWNFPLFPCFVANCCYHVFGYPLTLENLPATALECGLRVFVFDIGVHRWEIVSESTCNSRMAGHYGSCATVLKLIHITHVCYTPLNHTHHTIVFSLKPLEQCRVFVVGGNLCVAGGKPVCGWDSGERLSEQPVFTNFLRADPLCPCVDLIHNQAARPCRMLSAS